MLNFRLLFTQSQKLFLVALDVIDGGFDSSHQLPCECYAVKSLHSVSFFDSKKYHEGKGSDLCIKRIYNLRNLV